MALWLALQVLVVLAAVRLSAQDVKNYRKERGTVMPCSFALGAGCTCTGCPGTGCLPGAVHCACSYCIRACAAASCSGNAGISSGGGGSAGSGGGAAYSFGTYSPGSTVSGGGGGGGYASGGSSISGGGSYASGGIIPASRIRTGRIRASRAGIQGFDERGSADFNLAPGRVLGLRQWSVAPPDLSGSPLDTSWNPQYILGATSKQWTNAVFEATCNSNPLHLPPVEEDEHGTCGCGCWGYWSPAGMNDWVTRGHLPLAGIIEGTGRVLIGEKGFRCQRAKIVALSLPFLIRPAVQGPRDQVTERELAEAQQTADAWMAVIQDRIGQLFPDARMFATVTGMLATFPPGEKFQ